MISQRVSDTKTRFVSFRLLLGRYFLRVLLALSLLYYVAMVLDLILHPWDMGVGYDAFFEERVLSVLLGTGVMVIGVFIMRRVPGNRVGPLLMIYGIAGVSWETRADWGSPLLTSFTHLLLHFYANGVANAALLVLLLSFPSGQLYPRQVARWVIVYIVLLLLAVTLVIMAQRPGETVFFDGDLPLNPLLVAALAPCYLVIASSTVVLFLLGILATVVSLILRYRAAAAREQLQIKWFVWVTGIVLAFTMLIALILLVDPSNAALGSPLGIVLIILFTQLLQSYPALGIGIAILRHQLWDIDILINRTLVYGSLTAILLLLYLSLVFALQTVLQGLLDQKNEVAIVASTLAIAAVFQPLRQRIQTIIDRRFYRRKYHAARTLAAFSAVVRNEVDISRLNEHLLTVVEETMQPVHVSLWLRPPEKHSVTAHAPEKRPPIGRKGQPDEH